MGNRDLVNICDTNDVDYTIDANTNRYISIDGNNLTYDKAGSLTQDSIEYEYEYDYENRLVKITKDATDIAEYTYDALGRRIEKKDSITSANTLRYYYGDKWQVLAEYDTSYNLEQSYVYGNYIDEVLIMRHSGGTNYYYAHDHLYSPVALMNTSGSVVERYVYDAYGRVKIWNSDWTTERDTSDHNNPYYFTSRRLDELDDGDLKLMYYRNRYYDVETGRFLQHDPLGYIDGMNLYEYVMSNPLVRTDPYGYFMIEPLPIMLDDDLSIFKPRNTWPRHEKNIDALLNKIISGLRDVGCKALDCGGVSHEFILFAIPPWGSIKGGIEATGKCEECCHRKHGIALRKGKQLGGDIEIYAKIEGGTAVPLTPNKRGEVRDIFGGRYKPRSRRTGRFVSPHSTSGLFAAEFGFSNKLPDCKTKPVRDAGFGVRGYFALGAGWGINYGVTVAQCSMSKGCKIGFQEPKFNIGYIGTAEVKLGLKAYGSVTGTFIIE
ncbi:MAG: RHS repeat domain-containing protein [Planctomycetota bacterium]|jgi:RHS repeat-associated protein